MSLSRKFLGLTNCEVDGLKNRPMHNAPCLKLAFVESVRMSVIEFVGQQSGPHPVCLKIGVCVFFPTTTFSPGASAYLTRQK